MGSKGPIYSGMPAVDLGTEGWEKPWSGTNGGWCRGQAAARRQCGLPPVHGPGRARAGVHRDEMISFLEGAKSGQADFLVA